MVKKLLLRGQSLLKGELAMDDRFQTPYSHPRWWWYGDGGIPVCFGCTHFRGYVKGAVRCTVFWDGIPTEYSQSKDTVEEFPRGKHCIHFEKYIESD